MRFARRGIVWRVAAPSLVLSVVLLATVALAALALYRAQRDSDQSLDQALLAAESSERLDQVIHEFHQCLRDYAATGDIAKALRARGLGEEAGERVLQIDKYIISDKGHSLTIEMRQDSIELNESIKRIIAKAAADNRQAAVNRLMNNVLPAFLDRAREQRLMSVGALHAARERGRKATSRAFWELLLLGAGGALGGTFAGFWIARGLRRQLVELSIPIRTAMGSIAEVVGPLQVQSADNFDGLDTALDHLAGRVAEVIDRLQSAERQRLRNDQMAALGQLAAGLAHELRNPLTAMKTIVDAARRDGHPSALDSRDLAVLDEEITRLNRSLQSFLDYARPPKLAKSGVDLGQIAERTRQLVAARAAQQSIAVSIEQPDGPVAVDADPEQLRQVLLNLFLNAFDAIGCDGSVTIRILRDGDQASITVADSGPGISPAIRGRLFEPFVSSKESGTGLGLTICRRIIEDHGGRIEGTNGPAGGAVFTIRLPAGQTQHGEVIDRR